MAGIPLKSWLLLGVAFAALAACQPGTSDTQIAANPGSVADSASSADPTAPVAAATSARLIDHDVEAPDVFQTTDKALWDGRPSLGGVWVATANAKDPERVILRNPANGKFVIGALFRREADNPGPKLQISSDAADALGMLAGQPATINVTALRREEAPTSTDASKPLLDAAETVQPTPIDRITATASAAIDKATAKSTSGPAIPTAPATSASPEHSADTPLVTAAIVVQKPARTAPSAPPAARSLTSPEPQPVAEPTVVAIPPAPAAPSGASIQIGIFSVEDNANRAVKALGKAGITTTVRKEESHGKPLWSVIASGNAATLAKIKAAGFADAYVLKH